MYSKQPLFNAVLGVSVIGGYLGAGKTTLVNHLLRNAGGQRLAVLVNEFGTLPIDEDLIEAQDDALISIAGGCVCCSYGNDLVQSLIDLSKMQPVPDHVLIESSGVALPGAIAATISLIGGYALHGVIGLADAETIQAQSADPYIGDTIDRQLADADLVLLNKTDLVTTQNLAATQAWLKTKAKGAEVVPISQGKVPTELFFHLGPTRRDQISAAIHPAVFQSLSFVAEGVFDADLLAETLASDHLGLVRAKGFVPTATGVKLIQNVGRRWAVSDAQTNVQPGLVVIGIRETLDQSAILAALAAAQID